MRLRGRWPWPRAASATAAAPKWVDHDGERTNLEPIRATGNITFTGDGHSDGGGHEHDTAAAHKAWWVWPPVGLAIFLSGHGVDLLVCLSTQQRQSDVPDAGRLVNPTAAIRRSRRWQAG